MYFADAGHDAGHIWVKSQRGDLFWFASLHIAEITFPGITAWFNGR
jgi:hypothetical protein